jgi:hypothetical protein
MQAYEVNSAEMDHLDLLDRSFIQTLRDLRYLLENSTDEDRQYASGRVAGMEIALKLVEAFRIETGIKIIEDGPFNRAQEMQEDPHHG